LRDLSPALRKTNESRYKDGLSKSFRSSFSNHRSFFPQTDITILHFCQSLIFTEIRSLPFETQWFQSELLNAWRCSLTDFAEIPASRHKFVANMSFTFSLQE
jgi:hypothetical protein